MSTPKTPIQVTNNGSEDTSINAFCNNHGLLPSLLYVPGRVIDCWDTLADVKATLENVRDLQQSIRFANVIDHSAGGAAGIYRTHMWLCGSYPVNPEITDERWANPSYTHGPKHQEPVNEWETHVERAAAYPTVRLAHVARRFGLSRRALSKRVETRGWNFEERTRIGRRRIIRTMLTTIKWSEWTQEEVFEIFPLSRRQLFDWKQLVAEEWTPPAMPENARWV